MTSKTFMLSCPACSGRLHIEPRELMLQCSHCGSRVLISDRIIRDDFDADLAFAQESTVSLDATCNAHLLITDTGRKKGLRSLASITYIYMLYIAALTLLIYGYMVWIM